MRGALRNLNTAGADRLIEGIQATVLDGSGLRERLRQLVLVDSPEAGDAAATREA
jgi:hypothetical protein